MHDLREGGPDDPFGPAVPARPGTAPAWVQRFTGWASWFGPWRLATTALAVAVIAVAAWWLVRAPAPPAETTIPYAGGGSGPASATTDAVAAAAEDGPAASTVAASSVPTTVTIHVAGSVERPGVYSLPGGSRIQAAVVAAGGPTRRADLDAINMAAPAVDGAQIYVPARGETVPPVADAPSSASAPEVGSPSVADASTPVDVNMAALDELDTLPGVGPATATAIIQYRDENGPFASVDDLESVPGIGPVTLEAIRELVTV
ncbi:MAG: helix-hairpin-helix domain-containing protein [Actinomycetota bacterium]|nr:helix-hairpin-helix domain-containing protein [Actinomycetota bacterium]